MTTPNIELTRLYTNTDKKTGRTFLAGKLGFNARVRIEELETPDERGATHLLLLLPPFVKRDDDGGQNVCQRWQDTATPAQRQQNAPARQPQQSPAQPARAFGLAEESE